MGSGGVILVQNQPTSAHACPLNGFGLGLVSGVAEMIYFIVEIKFYRFNDVFVVP